MQLASLKVLRQAMQLVGMVEKGARQWDVSRAGSLFEAALGSRLAGTAAVTSAAVRLNSKVELSAMRKRAFAAAVSAGGLPASELSAEDKGILVRDHLVPSSTPNPTPQERRGRPKGSGRGRPSAGEDEEDGEEESEDSSASSEDRSNSAELATPKRRRTSAARMARGALSEAEPESGDERARTSQAAKRAPSTELKAITPPQAWIREKRYNSFPSRVSLKRRRASRSQRTSMMRTSATRTWSGQVGR